MTITKLLKAINNMETEVSMLLFARWIATNYGAPQYNVNRCDGNWWKERLEYFNKQVIPNMILNGSVEATQVFLNKKL